MPFYTYLEKLQQIEESYKRHKVKEADALRETLLEGIAKELGEKGVNAVSFILNNIDRERGIAVPDDPLGLSALLENRPKTSFELQYEKLLDDPARKKVYESLLPYAALAHLLDRNGEPTEHALKLTVLFLDKQKSLKYIAKFAEVNKKRRDDRDFYLMDAALMISFPPPEDYNVALWCKIASSGDNLFDQNFRGSVLPHAADIDQSINKDISHYLYRQEEKLNEMLSEFAKNLAEKQKKMESIQLSAGPLAAEEEGILKKLKREMLFIQGLQKKAETYKKDFFEKMQAMQKINSKEGAKTAEDVQSVNNYKQDLLKLCKKLNDEIYLKGATDENTVRQRELHEINKNLLQKEKEQEKIRKSVEKNIEEIARLNKIDPINTEAIQKLEKETDALKTKLRSAEEEIEKIMKSKIAHLPALPMLLENEKRLAILTKLAKEIEDVRYKRIAERDELSIADIDDIKSISGKTAALQKEILSQLQGTMKIDQIKIWLKEKVKIWKVLTENHSEISEEEEEIYKLLNNEISTLKVLLANAYAENGVPLEEADLDMVNAYEERHKKEGSAAYTYFLEHGLTSKDYEKFQKLDRTKGGILMPDITIDGATLGYAGFYLKKVNVLNDLEAARAACIGKLTDSCQSLSGEAGEPCTIHGLTDPRGGFYMLCKGDVNNPKVTDEMWGATWAWRSKQNNIVFDSVEMHPDFRKQGRDLAKGMFNELARQIVSDPKHDVESVYCGTESGISDDFGEVEADKRQIFVDYTGYSDAKMQKMIFHREAPYLLFQKIPSKEVSGLLYQQLEVFLSDCLKNTVSGKLSELINQESFSKMLEYIILKKQTDLFRMVGEILAKIAPLQVKFSDLEFIISNLQDLINNPQETDNHAFYLKIYGIINNRKLRDQWDDYLKLRMLELNDREEMKTIIRDPTFNVNFLQNGSTPFIELLRHSYGRTCLDLVETFLQRKDLDLNLYTEVPILSPFVRNLEIFKLILSKCTPEYVQRPAENGTTVLMEVLSVKGTIEERVYTCFDDEVLQRLVEKSNINHADSAGKTALMYAIENKNCHHILLLMKAGARTDLADNQGKRAMDYAQGNPILLELLKMPIESIPENITDLDEDLLTKALNLSDIDIIGSIIHAGSYIPSISTAGEIRNKIQMEESITKKALYQRLLELWTPRDEQSLTKSVAGPEKEQEQKQTVAVALGKSYSQDLSVKLFQAAMKLARGSISDDEIIALINNPALDVNDTQAFSELLSDELPLTFMLRNKVSPTVLKALLQREDLNVNVIDPLMETSVLIGAIESQELEIFNMLLSKCDAAFLNLKDGSGKTALMHAAEKGKIEFVKSLIKSGADVSAVDDFEMDAEEYAKSIALKALIREAKLGKPEVESAEVQPEPSVPQDAKQAAADELIFSRPATPATPAEVKSEVFEIGNRWDELMTYVTDVYEDFLIRPNLWDAATAKDLKAIYHFMQEINVDFLDDPRSSTECFQALFKEIETLQQRGVQNPNLKNLIEKIMQYKAELEPAGGFRPSS